MISFDEKWFVIACDLDFRITEIITTKNIEISLKVKDQINKIVSPDNVYKFLEFTLNLRSEKVVFGCEINVLNDDQSITTMNFGGIGYEDKYILTAFSNYSGFYEELMQINNEYVNLFREKLKKANDSHVDYQKFTELNNEIINMKRELQKNNAYISDLLNKKEEMVNIIETQKNFFKQMLNAIPDLIYYKDINSKYLGCNNAFAEKHIGLKEKDIIGKTDFDIIKDKKIASFFIQKDRELIEGGESKVYEVAIKMANGITVDVETLKTPFYDENGNIVGVIGIDRDISLRKSMEEKLRTSEEKFRRLFQNMTNGFSLHEVIVGDRGEAIDFRFLIVNKVYETQMNQLTEEVVGKTMLEINPLADKEMIQRYCEVGLTGKPMHLEYFSKTLNKYFSTVTYSPQKGLFASVFEDISKRKEMEEDISRISERLKLATKAANVGIWEYDIVNDTLIWDNAMYSLYGIKKEAFLGTFEAWQQLLHPQDLESARKHIDDAILGVRDFDTEFRVVWPAGSVHHIKANAIVLHDEKGNSIKMFGTNWDVTESIQYEEKLLKAKEQAEVANIAKSQFLANMSHEIRTPMNGMFGFLHLLETSNLSLEQKEFVREAKSASEVLMHLINDILDFSKIEAGKLIIEDISFNIRTTIEDAVSLLVLKAAEKRIGLHVMIKPSVPDEVIGDPSRLRQILNNLVSNAVKFTDNGEVSVIADCIEEENEIATLNFEVKDTGIGIRWEDIPKLFQSFNQADTSTTRKYGGTGLGLAISKELVKLMGGEICVESVLGKGSTFKFNLPLKISKRHADQKFAFEKLNGVNILVVDSNMNSRSIVSTYLEGEGLKVFEATDAGSAITKIISSASTKNKISIAVIDYELSEMTGYELADALKAIPLAKDIKLILINSVPQKGDALNAKEHGFSGYLTSPVRRDNLLNCIAIVLGLKKEEEGKIEVVTKHTVNELKNALKPKILLVEDNETNRKIVVMMLKVHAMTCDVAVNGREAYRAVLKKDYDVVFMDCQMPVMDGYESTAKIRALKGEKKNTTIIAMTANAMEGDSDKCIQAGMDDYISKPINFDNMFKIIEESMKSREQDSENFDLLDDYIDKFVNSTGLTRDDAQEIFEEFIKHLPVLMEDINNAIGNKDFQKLRALVHELKGASGNLRMTSIYELAIRLEQTAIMQEIDECSNLFSQIKNLFH